MQELGYIKGAVIMPVDLVHEIDDGMVTFTIGFNAITFGSHLLEKYFQGMGYGVLGYSHRKVL